MSVRVGRIAMFVFESGSRRSGKMEEEMMAMEEIKA